MKQPQDFQKSYFDKKRKDLEFVVGDKVFVKVVPYKHVMRFSKKRKASVKVCGTIRSIEAHR